MPYREKIAWLSLIAMVVVFVPYFSLVAWGPLHAEAMPGLRSLELYAGTAIVWMLILGTGHLVLRLQSPDEARLPPDERDRAIMHRAISLAYYVLIVGMILVGVVMPFSHGGWSIVHAALFMIVLAEIVHYAVAVFSYRRQA